ncbi:M23 family metallopeptidase [Falsibacillus albus]|uniref:M23 family peptidase n=1 Tax=Falsibacillus albus TaxID=2478915 RepID=A0A3L7K244_9BACI|nr:M23 family metallopeptidase [Falsibacillus albus]RLQ94752.1 M23 family peptidase [Falsibacillus albus]
MREEEKKRSSQSFFKKRWVFPAMYLVSAAILITAILWYQAANNDVAQPKGNGDDQLANNEYNNPSVEVNSALENFKMPVEDQDAAVIEKQFYDYNASEEDQEAALVVYNNSYHPNRGIDITMKDNKGFDVVAAMSGTVTNVKEDSLLGNVIEIEHEKGVVTQYQSVKDFKVQVGDQVKQGDVIASAGESLYNEEAGTHVHFEIRKDNNPVNPIEFFGKSLADLDAKVKEDAEKAKANVKEDQSTGSQTSDDQSGTDQSSDKKSDDQSGQTGDQKSDDQKSGDNADQSGTDNSGSDNAGQDNGASDETQDSGN